MNELSGLPKHDADKVEAAVAEFLEHLHDDLPEGPLSDHGDFISDRFLTRRTEAEYNRLAAIGKSIVDKYAEEHPIDRP